MGSLFHCDNPLIVTLTKICNMMLVSAFWLVCSLPLVTAIPAAAALFHTTAKVVRGSGNGVARAFFASFRANLKQGVFLTALWLPAGLLLYTCLDFGWQLRGHALGLAYWVIAALLCAGAAGVLLLSVAVLSRFEAKLSVLLRLSCYFAMKRPARVLCWLALLAVASFACWFYPVLILLLPGVYCDITCAGVEKLFGLYVADARKPAPKQPAPPAALRLPTALEQAAMLERE